MTPIETIKHLTIRANALAAMNEPDEDAYWQLKEELFEAERMWTLETLRYYWPKAMKNDLTKLSDVLWDVWHKIVKFKYN